MVWEGLARLVLCWGHASFFALKIWLHRRIFVVDWCGISYYQTQGHFLLLSSSTGGGFHHVAFILNMIIILFVWWYGKLLRCLYFVGVRVHSLHWTYGCIGGYLWLTNVALATNKHRTNFCCCLHQLEEVFIVFLLGFAKYADVAVYGDITWKPICDAVHLHLENILGHPGSTWHSKKSIYSYVGIEGCSIGGGSVQINTQKTILSIPFLKTQGLLIIIVKFPLEVGAL